MQYNFNEKTEEPFLHSKNGIIINLNSEFIKFTGYSRDQLIGKSLAEISCLLKINSQMHLEELENDYQCYVFNSSYQPREVTISCRLLELKDEKMYFFKEKLNSEIEDKCMFIEQLYAEQKIGFAVHSVPDLILLKANETYLNYLDAPYNNKENSIGKKQKEIVTGFEGSKEEDIFLEVIKNGKSYHSVENKYDNFKRGTAYWQWSVVPIFVDGKIKYIIDTAEEATERVLNRKFIKEQTEFIEKQKEQQLEAIIENMSDGLFTLDKNYNYSLLKSGTTEFFYNSHLMKKSQDSLVHTKYYDREGNLILAEDLPNRKVLKGEKIREYRIKCDRPDGIYYFDISGSPIYDENGQVEKAIMCYRNVTEKVNNETLIRIQKEQLETILENITDNVLVLDKEGNIIKMNTEAKNHFFRIDSVKSFEELHKIAEVLDINGNEISFKDSPLCRAYRGEKVRNFKMIVKQQEKELIVEANALPVYDKNGSLNMVVMCNKDITDLVQKKKIIKQQKEELEAIIEGMSDMLLIFDKDGNYITFNQAARDNFFVETTKLKKVGDSLKETECLDINKQLISYDNFPSNRVLRGEKLIGYRMAIKTKDDVVYNDINGTPIYDNEGKFMAGILCCRDITEKIKYEKSLLIKTQYDFLNRMIDNLDLPVLRISYPNSKVIDVNQKAYNIFKKLKPEIKSISFIIGQNYEDITNFDKKEVSKHIVNVVKNKESSYLKNQRLVVSGEEMFMNLLYQPVFGVDGEVSEIVGILIDVTQEVMVNNQMEKILKTHEEFFANISHELKTPLNVIFSTTQLFNSYLKDDFLSNNKDKIVKYTNIMMQNCHRLSKLINNLVDLSKIESGLFKLNLSNENIVNVVEEVVQLVSEYVKNKGFTVTFDTDVEEKIIACDSSKIERVILNLISNSIKFSNPGDQIYVNITDKHDNVEISVKDNGMGIDGKNLDSIFERFKQVDKSFTRNAEGSGIGLCLVKAIVELHGGKINVESKLGEGSNFKIDLPLKVIEEINDTKRNERLNGNIDMVNMEFSDIYS